MLDGDTFMLTLRLPILLSRFKRESRLKGY